MSKNTDLDLQILSEDYKAPISLEKLDQLSSIQLAIAAGTSEVDTLTRQRAYHSFATRKLDYERRGPTGDTDGALQSSLRGCVLAWKLTSGASLAYSSS
jgi:hypothetical protein